MVPANCWENLTNCGEVTTVPSRGVEILLATSCYRTGISSGHYEPGDSKASLGSLSTRVFETRTVTGSELFLLLTCPRTTTFTLPSIFSPLEMSSTKIWETMLSKHAAKYSLPVVVRVSKTRVLKLPTIFSLRGGGGGGEIVIFLWRRREKRRRRKMLWRKTVMTGSSPFPNSLQRLIYFYRLKNSCSNVVGF